jgi:hypothetical protein
MIENLADPAAYGIYPYICYGLNPAISAARPTKRGSALDANALKPSWILENFMERLSSGIRQIGRGGLTSSKKVITITKTR